jgi:hypothetical protein
MDIATAKKILSHKEPRELYEVVEPVLEDAELRRILVEGSFDKNETFRYNCSRVLFRALDREPRLFYPYWDAFTERIQSPNGFHRSVAAQAVAFMVSIDHECRLDKSLRSYFALLDDPKVMVSHYFIEPLDRVCRARPDLQARIVKLLFGIDQTSHPVSRRELLKADILAVFDRLFATLTPAERTKVGAFAESCLVSESGKTRKAAKSFLSAHPQ